MTVGSGCLCSVPSPAWPLLSIAPRLASGSAAFGGTRPAPSLEPVGSWTHGLAGQPESYLSRSGSGRRSFPRPPHAGKGAEAQTLQRGHPSAAASRALQAWWAPRGQRGPPSLLLSASQWRGWPLPYSSPPHTPSRCPGSRWGSQRPAWSPPSSPGTVACDPAAAAGCWGRGLTRASQRSGRGGPPKG